MGKILAMPTSNYNVSSVEEPTSSIGINHNGDPKHVQNSKKLQRIQICLNQERGNIFSLNYKFNCRQSLLDNRIGKMMKVAEKSNFNFPICK